MTPLRNKRLRLILQPLIKRHNYVLTLIFQVAFACSMEAQVQNPAPVFPRMAGYVGILHPLVTYSGDGTTKNFEHSYTVGMPLGINIWKTSKVGFSLEIVPFIRAENGTSKTSNLLIHPGILYALGSGFTFAGRAAFETGGRYGFTPVLNKVVRKNKNSSYFVAVPLPVRFGNNHPAAASIGLQVGIAF
jgi:hypothetical protein